MNNFDEIENQIRADAPTLPPQLRHRVLEQCAAQRQSRARRGRRGNRALLCGFAFVVALQVFVGGWLDAQQRALLGPEHAQLLASAPSENYGARPTPHQMQAQLLAFINADELQRSDYVANQ